MPKRTKAPHARAAPLRWRLVVMAKEPVMGRVKTRLSREIGPAAAVRFYRATAGAVLGRLCRDPRFETSIAMAPDAGVATRAFPRALRRVPQGGGDLGARLQRAADRAPRGPVVIIGTDIPGIRADMIAAAFRALGSHHAVFGPAEDGGYWLVGLRRRPAMPRAFRPVRWSTAETLADTLANLAGRRVAFVATLPDVDSAADLRRNGHLLGRRILPRLHRG